MTTRLPTDEGRIEGSILAGTGLDVGMLHPFYADRYRQHHLTERDWLAIAAWHVGRTFSQAVEERKRAARKAKKRTRKLRDLAEMLDELRQSEQEGRDG